MIELVILFAAAGAEPVQAEPRSDPPITVRGNRVVCRRVHLNSAQSRLQARRICQTEDEWEEAREQAGEWWADFPRRNPRRPGRTIPDANGN